MQQNITIITDNDTSINNLKNNIEAIELEINNNLININKLRYDLNKKKNDLLNICSHSNKIRKRYDGPYGERYWYCDKCGLEF